MKRYNILPMNRRRTQMNLESEGQGQIFSLIFASFLHDNFIIFLHI